MTNILDSLQGSVHQVLTRFHGHRPAQSFICQAFVRAAIDSWWHQGLQLQTRVSFPGVFILSVRLALAVAAARQLLPQPAHLHPKAKIVHHAAVLHPCT